MSAGRSQADVARAAHISQAHVGRIERGVHTHVAFDTLVILGAMVGLDVVGSTFAGAGVIRDAPQARLLGRLRVRTGPDWEWRHEVLVRPNDQRAWDARVQHRSTGATFVVEAETRIHDIQALLRRIASKREASGGVRVVLLVADTHRNREAIAAAHELLRTEFPCPQREALQAIAHGLAPAGDALIVLGPRRGESSGD
jgi:Helix-turn-helix